MSTGAHEATPEAKRRRLWRRIKQEQRAFAKMTRGLADNVADVCMETWAAFMASKGPPCENSCCFGPSDAAWTWLVDQLVLH